MGPQDVVAHRPLGIDACRSLQLELDLAVTFLNRSGRAGGRASREQDTPAQRAYALAGHVKRYLSVSG